MGHNEKTEYYNKFVNYITDLIKKNKGVAAHLRRSINESEEDKAWGYLVKFGVDIGNDYEKAPYILVASSLANEDLGENRDFCDGDSSFGKALRSCYDEESGSAEARLRRVLSCANRSDACKVIAKIMPMIQSRSSAKISYATLLEDLYYFGGKVKRRWATDFYKTQEEVDGDSDKAKHTH